MPLRRFRFPLLLFLLNRRGNVAITFGILVIPILSFVGAAIDYSRALAARSHVQQALDAAVLAAGSFGAGRTDAERIERGMQVFAAHMENKKGRAINQPVITIDGNGVIRGAVNGDIGMIFMGILGIKAVDIGAYSAAALPQSLRAEIVLVLDYSGSMNRRGKYQAMRDAAKDFIEIMEEENTETKFALVPFSEYVYGDMQTEFIRGVHPDKYGHTVTACLNSRRYSYAVEDSTPELNVQDSKWPAPGMEPEWTQPGTIPGYEEPPVTGEVAECRDFEKIESKQCTLDAEEAEKQCQATVEKTIAQCEEKGKLALADPSVKVDADAVQKDVEGCQVQAKKEYYNCAETTEKEEKQCLASVQSLEAADQCHKAARDEGGEAQSEKSISDFADVNPMCADYRNRNVQMVPLTDDVWLLKDRLNSMTPIKMTNIALALEFGWHVISEDEPFEEGEPYGDEEVVKSIVLLTDGAQTVGGYGPGGSFSISQANENILELCTGIKERDIILMTVAFDLRGNNQIKNLLKQCASGDDYFFDADSNSELAVVFQEIAMRLRKDLVLVE